METLKAITRRKSSRNFDPARQLPEAELETILAAGCAAPVGMGDYMSLHLTVIQDRAILDTINKTAQKTLRAERDFLYNAPVLVIVSASAKQLGPNVQYANAACVIENMLLAATDKGIGSVYIWGAITGIAGNKELCKKLGIPGGFTPVSGAAMGYVLEGDNATEKTLIISRSINYI